MTFFVKLASLHNAVLTKASVVIFNGFTKIAFIFLQSFLQVNQQDFGCF